MEIKLKDLIYVEKQFFSNEKCEEYIKYFEKNSSNSFKEISRNSYTDMIENATFSALEIKSGSSHHFNIKNSFKSALSRYLKHLDSLGLYNVSLSKYYKFAHSFRILKYNIGEKIHPHSDHSLATYLSIVINLSEDYEGGEFSFFNKKLNINLKKGDLMIFPADNFFIHEVQSIKSGIRYSINSFIRSMPEEVFKSAIKSLSMNAEEYLKNTDSKYINGPFF